MHDPRVVLCRQDQHARAFRVDAEPVSPDCHRDRELQRHVRLSHAAVGRQKRRRAPREPAIDQELGGLRRGLLKHRPVQRDQVARDLFYLIAQIDGDGNRRALGRCKLLGALDRSRDLCAPRLPTPDLFAGAIGPDRVHQCVQVLDDCAWEHPAADHAGRERGDALVIRPLRDRCDQRGQRVSRNGHLALRLDRHRDPAQRVEIDPDRTAGVLQRPPYLWVPAGQLVPPWPCRARLGVHPDRQAAVAHGRVAR